MKVLVIGESCKDVFHYGSCHRMCPEAPVPVFNPIEKMQNGGMAMNVRNNLIALGVECVAITNHNWENILKVRYIDQRTNQMFIRVDYCDYNYSHIGDDINKIDFGEYSAVIVSDYNKGFLSEKDIEFICLSHNCVFLDTKKKLGTWCDKALFIKINVYELEKTIDTVTDDLFDKLIVTMGENGCSFGDVTYPVESVEMKDSSGAGDTFIAALAADYIQTKDIKKSIVFANDCATRVVQKRGVSTA